MRWGAQREMTGENARGGRGQMRRSLELGSMCEDNVEVPVTGGRRRTVTVVQWNAAARAKMVIALGWVMHDRMARVSDWGVT